MSVTDETTDWHDLPKWCDESIWNDHVLTKSSSDYILITNPSKVILCVQNGCYHFLNLVSVFLISYL